MLGELDSPEKEQFFVSFQLWDLLFTFAMKIVNYYFFISWYYAVSAVVKKYIFSNQKQTQLNLDRFQCQIVWNDWIKK